MKFHDTNSHDSGELRKACTVKFNVVIFARGKFCENVNQIVHMGVISRFLCCFHIKVISLRVLFLCRENFRNHTIIQKKTQTRNVSM